MKKLVGFILAVCLVATLCGCGCSKRDESSETQNDNNVEMGEKSDNETVVDRTDGVWNKTNGYSGLKNEVEIFNETEDGFELKARCVNGDKTGYFEGSFEYTNDVIAYCRGVSDKGDSYTVVAEFVNDTMSLSVVSENDQQESQLFGFDTSLSLSGKYKIGVRD